MCRNMTGTAETKSIVITAGTDGTIVDAQKTNELNESGRWILLKSHTRHDHWVLGFSYVMSCTQ